MSANTDPVESHAGWPGAWLAALSDAALVEASSAAIVARGASYFRSGAVDVDDEDPMPEPALRARVTGTSEYSVEVWIEAEAIAGHCDCPHAEDGWFCKHQVAVAMVWRQRLAGEPRAAAGDALPEQGRAPRTALERRQALHAFLHGQDAASLADKLLDLAARDRALERELQQWRKLRALEGDWAGIRRVVSDMLSPGRGDIAWDEAESYVARAAAVLPVLRQATARDPTAAVSLAIHALRAVWAALEVADDSEGVLEDFCLAIGAELVAALQAAPEAASSFGENYLALRLDEPCLSFDARDAEAAMGSAALNHYRRTLQARWRAALDARLASRAGAAPGAAAHAAGVVPGAARVALQTASRTFSGVERLHLEQLVRAGDIDEALAVLRSDLTTPFAHRRVVVFLEERGRYREAFAAAEAAARQYPEDRFLEDDLLRCYERDGWTEEAFAVRLRQFERQPSVERFQAVVAAGAAAARPAEAVRTALFDVLHSAERGAMDEEAARVGRLQSRGFRGAASLPGAPRVPSGPNVSLRASILCAESRWLDAWDAVQAPSVCTDAVLQHIARHLPPTHRLDAVRVLTQIFERVMQRSSSPYQEALALVADIALRMQADERSTWLHGLRVRYKSKRNFIRDLPSG